MKRLYILILLLILGGSSLTSGQAVLKLNNTASSLVLEGTSNLHDWEMNAERMTASLSAIVNNGTLGGIREVKFMLFAENIVSGNSIMDKKTQKALNADIHKSITFMLTEPLDIDSGKDKFSGMALGMLTISGISKHIRLPFSAQVNSDNILFVEGKEEINMLDYKIEPPTAMMGALKTGEKVTVKFSLEFEPAKTLSSK